MGRILDRPLRDPWVVAAVRTPVGRYGGALASVRPDDLAALVLRAVVDRAGIDPGQVEDVILGCANQAGEDNRDVARMAAPAGRLPGRGRRADRQPAVRLRPPGDQLGGPRHPGRRRRRVHRRRRRVDDPGALRHGQARGRLRPGRSPAGRHHARLALRQPEARRAPITRTRWARPPRTSPSAGTSSRDAPGRLRARQPAQGRRRDRGRPLRRARSSRSRSPSGRAIRSS